MLIDKKTETIVRQYLPNTVSLANLSRFFSALSDPTRLKIISALSISPMCVTDLAEVLSLNQTTLSHQLSTLRNCGCVEVKRQGKISFYSLSDPSILQVMDCAVR